MLLPESPEMTKPLVDVSLRVTGFWLDHPPDAMLKALAARLGFAFVAVVLVTVAVLAVAAGRNKAGSDSIPFYAKAGIAVLASVAAALASSLLVNLAHLAVPRLGEPGDVFTVAVLSSAVMLTFACAARHRTLGAAPLLLAAGLDMILSSLSAASLYLSRDPYTAYNHAGALAALVILVLLILGGLSLAVRADEEFTALMLHLPYTLAVVLITQPLAAIPPAAAALRTALAATKYEDYVARAMRARMNKLERAINRIRAPETWPPRPGSQPRTRGLSLQPEPRAAPATHATREPREEAPDQLPRPGPSATGRRRRQRHTWVWVAASACGFSGNIYASTLGEVYRRTGIDPDRVVAVKVYTKDGGMEMLDPYDTGYRINRDAEKLEFICTGTLDAEDGRILP